MRKFCIIVFICILQILGIWILYNAIEGPKNNPNIDSIPSTSHTISKKPIILLVPGFSVTSINTFSNDDSNFYECTPDAVPVITHDSSTYFEDFPIWLIHEGFDVRIAYLENNYKHTPSILENVDCLRLQILRASTQSPTNDVIVIAHSMGGLVTRAYLQSKQFQIDRQIHNKSLVNKVFLVATPNQSMPFHFWLNLLLDCEASTTTQRAACEFSSSEWINEFNQTYKDVPLGLNIYLIGGTIHNGVLGFLAGCYICLLAGPNDGTIPTQSSIGLENVGGKAVFPETHKSGVGLPSYFSEYLGSRSRFYTDCVYPVLVNGDPDGCQGDAPQTCPSLLALGIWVFANLLSIKFLIIFRKL